MKDETEDRVVRWVIIIAAVAAVFAALCAVLALIHQSSLIDQCVADGQPRWMCEGLLR